MVCSPKNKPKKPTWYVWYMCIYMYFLPSSYFFVLFFCFCFLYHHLLFHRHGMTYILFLCVCVCDFLFSPVSTRKKIKFPPPNFWTVIRGGWGPMVCCRCPYFSFSCVFAFVFFWVSSFRYICIYILFFCQHIYIYIQKHKPKSTTKQSNQAKRHVYVCVFLFFFSFYPSFVSYYTFFFCM